MPDAMLAKAPHPGNAKGYSAWPGTHTLQALPSFPLDTSRTQDKRCLEQKVLKINIFKPAT